jgi:lysophospholipase L1-like esterase
MPVSKLRLAALGVVSLGPLVLPFLSVGNLCFYGVVLLLFIVGACSWGAAQQMLEGMPLGTSRRFLRLVRVACWLGFLVLIVPIQNERPPWTSLALAGSLIGLWWAGERRPVARALCLAVGSGVVALAAAQESAFFIGAWTSVLSLLLLRPSDLRTVAEAPGRVWTAFRWTTAAWMLFLAAGAWPYFGHFGTTPALSLLHTGWPRHAAALAWAMPPLLLLMPFLAIRTRLHQRAFRICLGCVAAFVAAEMLLRFVGPMGYGLPGDAEKEDLADRLYRTNQAGFRDVAHELAKPPSVRRILTLGDSVTFGAMVTLEGTFSRQLQRMLDQRLPNSRFEVVNVSRSGWNTGEELRALQDVGLAYSPDIVVLGFVLNDAESGQEGFADRTLLSGRHDLAMRWSYVYSLVCYAHNRLLELGSAKQDYRQYLLSLYEPGSSGWPECKAHLGAMAKVCRETGAGLVVVVFPILTDFADYPFAVVHRELAAWVTASGAEVIDLLPVYREHSPRSLMASFADGHPNALGHALAAEAIFRKVSEVAGLQAD